MKRYRIALPDGATVLYLNMADDATPEEVAAKAEIEVAKLRAEVGESEPVSLPPPPPPPWEVAGEDPLDKELRCSRCGGVKKRRDMQRHLRECFP